MAKKSKGKTKVVGKRPTAKAKRSTGLSSKKPRIAKANPSVAKAAPRSEAVIELPGRAEVAAPFEELVDLAAERLGGAVLWANDEFFAERDNLLKEAPAIFIAERFTDRGKWMDGWETRRRRQAGYDTCIIRLGVPGVVRGVVVDTAFFRGNFPESCSIDGLAVEGTPSIASLVDSDAWQPLLEKTLLRGDSKNRFAVSGERRVTHLRLNIFPDGGVARLRVFGEARPDWANLVRRGGQVDLVALENGGRALSCSDMFFSDRRHLLLPEGSTHMADGWETRRRRGPGHDWVIVALGRRGVIERVVLETTHFKGNAPDHCFIEVCDSAQATTAQLESQAMPWRPLLDRTQLLPHTRHELEAEVQAQGPVTHARLRIYPDGGVARLRLWGRPEPVDAAPGVAALNGLDELSAAAMFRDACASDAWVRGMLRARPFVRRKDVLRAAADAWEPLGSVDWLEAFRGHPEIGSSHAAAGQSAVSAGASAGEQAAVTGAEEALRLRIAELNAEYRRRFGFIYIVRAAGRSAEELLARLESRLDNDRDTELSTAAAEQLEITELRLARWLDQHG